MTEERGEHDVENVPRDDVLVARESSRHFQNRLSRTKNNQIWGVLGERSWKYLNLENAEVLGVHLQGYRAEQSSHTEAMISALPQYIQVI